ncbi:hypothetical protein SORBI_3003G032700 [Sorghum bicolor]|uniref:Uncharacterized protein n=1 Tax=Sorghum bicolor TaxID=4558 RepID=A0A1B6Q137_SORBI|nr:hypothetical protein SORBI_3003G032700 [Sorghum bicolor]
MCWAGSRADLDKQTARIVTMAHPSQANNPKFLSLRWPLATHYPSCLASLRLNQTSPLFDLVSLRSLPTETLEDDDGNGPPCGYAGCRPSHSYPHGRILIYFDLLKWYNNNDLICRVSLEGRLVCCFRF